MRIHIIEAGIGNYQADLVGLPGSPPVGNGDSPNEAIISLLRSILHETKWMQYIDFNGLRVTIDDSIVGGYCQFRDMCPVYKNG